MARPVMGRLAGVLRLRGPLSEEPTARVLHALLLGLLVWCSLHILVFQPLFGVRKPGSLALAAAQATTAVLSLYLLRRGWLRKSAMVVVVGAWLLSTVLIVLNGGIRSPGIAFYTALPVLTAWLLGYRAALVATATSIGSALVLALLETAGLGPYWYFPGRPIPIWTIVVAAILIAAVPVARVMRVLQDALAQSKLDQEALRRERDLMSRIMETSPAGILALNRNGEIRFANAQGASVLGTTPDEIRRSSYDSAQWRITTYDGQPLLPELLPFRQVRSRREVIHGMPMAVQPGDQRILLSVNAAPLVDAAGEFDGVVATVEDVTQRNRVERELYRLQENLMDLVDERTAELLRALDQAQSANRAKAVFLANMSHELRTPLNAILGFSHLMRAGEGVSASQAEALDIISRSGHNLLTLIDDILDMARLEASQDRLEITTVDMMAVVRDVMTMVRASVEEKNLEFSSVWSGPPVRLVCLDGPKLRQILVNLVGNAVKYTDVGSIHLRMCATPVDDTGKTRLRIEVQDTGIGIAPEEQGQIFEPFVQLGQPNSRKGSGLGLAISRRLAQMMGGTIQVESAPGRGSTFHVELPVDVARESPASSSDEETVSKPVTDARPRGLAGVAGLPEVLKSQLLKAVQLLDKERITEVTRLVSVVDPALGSELTRHADAFEFTAIRRAIQPAEVA